MAGDNVTGAMERAAARVLQPENLSPGPEVLTARLSPAWSWRRQPTLADNLTVLASLAGPANIVMQLGRPATGYGVVNSTVDSGRFDLHPFRRGRATFLYLAVASWGTPEQKAAYRKAVNRAHGPVHSDPGDPVQYNAFDPELQKWVAACLYKGAIDLLQIFFGPITSEQAENCLHEGAALGTTLQMPVAMWPPTCADFDEYWDRSMDAVHIDDHVRSYLYDIASGTAVTPRLLRPLVGPYMRLMTTCFLPQRFRDEMCLRWSPSRERVFKISIALLVAANRLLPNMIRRFPFNVLMRDLDRRIQTARPLL